MTLILEEQLQKRLRLSGVNPNMNLLELQRALRQLRLGGMAQVLETRLRQAQAEAMAPIDLISCLVADELTRRSDRLLERRRKQAGFRDPDKTLDNFDFTFNPKMNRSLVFDLATAAFLGPMRQAGKRSFSWTDNTGSRRPSASCRGGKRHDPHHVLSLWRVVGVQQVPRCGREGVSGSCTSAVSSGVTSQLTGPDR